MDYIIVQAGGKGSRLGALTKNKPKALVPVENLPMLFHLFRKFPDKRFIIIADYQREVLRRYLRAFAGVKHLVVDAKGTGTAAGLRQALPYIPAGEPFMLIWCDLILPRDLELPTEYTEPGGSKPEADYIGISRTFPCRWSYEDGVLKEERSVENGVAGCFLFRDKRLLEHVPENGEFVRWLGEQGLVFKRLDLSGTREFGLLSEYEKLTVERCRPFNRITVEGDILTKHPVDEQSRVLAAKEAAWYMEAERLGLDMIPAIYATEPLKMELIRGRNIYECALPRERRERILEDLIAVLDRLHSSKSAPVDYFSMKETYFNKTLDRISAVRDLIPLAGNKTITVNGRRCRNIFFYLDTLERRVDSLRCDRFHFIHGDCTFSNMMLREDGRPVLLDPRGYFGSTALYGDVRYDWAKLYYSIVGNYDRFNLKRFSLDIGGERASKGKTARAMADGEVVLQIESNGWEDLEGDFFRLSHADPDEIKLLHALIWLSLTTYIWQDHDSICGAFYNGLYYLEEVL